MKNKDKNKKQFGKKSSKMRQKIANSQLLNKIGLQAKLLIRKRIEEELKAANEQLHEEIADRKRVEKALRESENKYRALFEKANDAILLLKEDGTIVDCNTKMLAMFGCQRKEIIGTLIYHYLPTVELNSNEPKKKSLEKINAAWSGKPQFFECKHTRLDGTSFTAEVSLSRIEMQDWVMVQAIIRDITKRKQVEAVLQESEKKLKQQNNYLNFLIENMNELVFTYNTHGNITWVNKKAWEALGYLPDEMIGRKTLDFTHEDDKGKVQKGFQLRLEIGKPGSYEIRMPHKDGSDRFMKINASSIIENNEIIGGMVLAEDITELKQTMETLRKSENNYRTIFENTGTAITIIEDNTIILLANKEFEKLSGYSKKEIEGKKSWTEFVMDDDLAKIKEHYQRRSYPHAVIRNEFRFIDRQGNVKDIVMTIGVIPGTRKSVASLLDITEPKKTQEELKRIINELRCTKNILRDREKLAIVGQMAAGMAHEIKNPLTAVKGFAQLLKQKFPCDQTITGYAAIILNEADQANKVITNFLQLARPKSPVLKRQSVNSLLDEILDIVEPQAFLKNVKVKYECIMDLPHCLLDRDHIKQALLNMCQNAIEAMPEGGIITISLGLISVKEIYIDIRDTGCGIPQDKLDNIGVPFYTTKDNGTGLGLGISYAIIDAHKGRVEVDSKEGEGTRFRVCLPLA